MQDLFIGALPGNVSRGFFQVFVQVLARMYGLVRVRQRESKEWDGEGRMMGYRERKMTFDWL